MVREAIRETGLTLQSVETPHEFYSFASCLSGRGWDQHPGFDHGAPGRGAPLHHRQECLCRPRLRAARLHRGGRRPRWYGVRHPKQGRHWPGQRRGGWSARLGRHAGASLLLGCGLPCSCRSLILVAYCAVLGPWVKSHPLVFSRIDRGNSAKTRQFASSDMLVNLMIQPVSSCCLRFQWYRLPALSLERLPVESSVYMGNGWFGYAVMLWVITVNTYVCLQPVLVESSIHMGNG